MLRPTHRVWLLGGLFAAAVALSNALWLGRVAAAYWIARPGDFDSLSRAASLVPFTADSYAPDLSMQAGHLLDSQGRVDEALAFYRASLARDPYSNPGWLLVASAEERAGRQSEAERAYERAASSEPNRPETYWMRANLKLRRGRTQESLADFRDLLARNRRFDGAVFETAANLVNLERAEAEVLPPGGEADLPYFRFTLERRDSAAAARGWKRLGARAREVSAQEVEHYCRLQAEAGLHEAAWVAWAEWSPPAAARDGVEFNGDFEHEPAGAPFDWVLRSDGPIHGFRDTTVAHGPAASLQVLYLGTENVDRVAVERWVHLKPRTRYKLSLYWRSRGVTTDQAPAIEIWPIDAATPLTAIRTEPGTSAWRGETAGFTTGNSVLARIVVIRRASSKIDNRIAGSLWLDDIRIEREGR